MQNKELHYLKEEDGSKTTTFFELDSFAGTAIPLELREKLFQLTLLEFTSLLEPITTDVNSDTPVAWSCRMVGLTRILQMKQ